MTRTPKRNPLAVFDIDGVLADVRHRLHHLEARPQRWEHFFQSADRDPLLVEGAERVRAALAAHDVLYLTGRPERTRRLTEDWLVRHDLPVEPLVCAPTTTGARPAGSSATCCGSSPPCGGGVGARRRPRGRSLLEADGWPVELATWLPHSSTLRKAQEDTGRT